MATINDSLCDTAKILSTALDGASERAVLVADDGTVLHMNDAASHSLYHTSAVDSGQVKVTDFFICSQSSEDNDNDDDNDEDMDWRSLRHCRVVMNQGDKGTPKTTRTERNIRMTQLAPCPCCERLYYTAFISSKHERVRKVVDHAFDPVLTIDCSGTICTANEAVTELFGYAESELIGRNIKMICGGGHAPNHDKYISSYLETGVKKVLGKKLEVLAKKKNGDEFPCELGVQEISDCSTTGKRYFCGFIKDLSLLKQHEAEVQERQDLQQGMINASLDPMLEIDEAGIIQIVNNAACAMFGYHRDELLGSNISIICGDGHAEHHGFYLRRYLDGGEKHVIGKKRQVKAKRKDGSEVEVELSVQEVLLLTGKKAFCGFIRDLTQQRKDKRALKKSQQIIHGKFFGGGEAAES